MGTPATLWVVRGVQLPASRPPPPWTPPHPPGGPACTFFPADLRDPSLGGALNHATGLWGSHHCGQEGCAWGVRQSPQPYGWRMGESAPPPHHPFPCFRGGANLRAKFCFATFGAEEIFYLGGALEGGGRHRSTSPPPGGLGLGLVRVLVGGGRLPSSRLSRTFVGHWG